MHIRFDNFPVADTVWLSAVDHTNDVRSTVMPMSLQKMQIMTEYLWLLREYYLVLWPRWPHWTLHWAECSDFDMHVVWHPYMDLWKPWLSTKWLHWTDLNVSSCEVMFLMVCRWKALVGFCLTQSLTNFSLSSQTTLTSSSLTVNQFP